VTIGAPPAGEHAIGEHDHIPRLLFTVDDNMAEAVTLDPRHQLTSAYFPCRASGMETFGRDAGSTLLLSVLTFRAPEVRVVG
jgi:hypothetical protein